MNVTKKSPPDLPEKGDYVRLRSDVETGGWLSSYNPENNWARVIWERGKGPTLCHRFELMKIDRPSN